MLTWSAGNSCTAQFSSDDCTAGEKVTPDIVRIGCILFYSLNLYFLGFAGFYIADCSIFAPKCPDLVIPAICTGYFSPVNTNMGFSWS